MNNISTIAASRRKSQSNPGPSVQDVPATSTAKSSLSLRSDKITDLHLQKLALVYVRQSTQQQVLEHRESTARQYALVDRAVALDWPRQAVQVIDEDQGLSGISIVGRNGFQRLLAEVSSDRVGLILGLEMSRFARSCKDWHTLLELCSIYRTLLADADGLYDPSQYNDRLLLGLKGTMSEAELHILKSRLLQGMWNKAERAEILNHPPLGYVRTLAGDFVIDPDEQVQQTVRSLFEQFGRRGTVSGLLNWLVENQVKIPIRPHQGPNRGELERRRPNRPTMLNLLHHPIYAGAYRWGHRSIDARKKVPGKVGTGRTYNAAADCRVLIPNRFPAYITWDEFERNQRQLSANSALAFGSLRHGPSILSGLIVCGRCGHRMLVGYTNKNSSKTLRYRCVRDAVDYGAPLCQSLSGAVLEAFVSERLLQAVSPASLELSLAATKDLQREREQVNKLWGQRLERSRCEVNRLAGNTLQWIQSIGWWHVNSSAAGTNLFALMSNCKRITIGSHRRIPRNSRLPSASRFISCHKNCPHCGIPLRPRRRIAKRLRGSCCSRSS
jgi:DNA invertase Pin-like site-specific DNA recombinase